MIWGGGSMVRKIIQVAVILIVVVVALNVLKLIGWDVVPIIDKAITYGYAICFYGLLVFIVYLTIWGICRKNED